MIPSRYGTARSGNDRGVIRGSLLSFPNPFPKLNHVSKYFGVWGKDPQLN